MAFALAVAQDKKTGQKILLFGAEPEPWSRPQICNMLRMLKREFPDLYQQVNLELVVPVNGRAGLEIPDDAFEEKNR